MKFNYKTYSFTCILGLNLFSCNRMPQACPQENKEIYLSDPVWISNLCSKHQKTTIINWGDETIDTFENSKKGDTYTHFYNKEGLYISSLKELSKKGNLEDEVIFTVTVIDTTQRK